MNYAIKTLAGHAEPRKLNGRAKRMYAQEAMNLALAFPYLAPLLDECVFTPYYHDGLRDRIAVFTTALVKLGAKKIYPDTIAQALYLALKHEVVLGLTQDELAGIVELDDCVTNVLLLQYAKKYGLEVVQAAVKKRANSLKTDDARELDRHWLLIYQAWSVAELEGTGQGFLAKLKGKGFEFFEMPSKKLEVPSAVAVPIQAPQLEDPLATAGEV